MKKKITAKRLSLAGLALGFAFIIISRLAYGVGFLFTVLAMLSFLASFVSVLYLPFKNTRIKKAVKIVKVMTFTAAIVGVISFVTVQALIISGWPDNDSTDAQCLIVLGAGINGERLSYVLHSRLVLAADYMHQNPDCLAIVSGGQGPGEAITEALAMKRYLVDQGIADARIIMEDQSTSTVENLRFSARLLQELGLEGEPVAIVSNSFHLYRARLIADYIGLEAQTLGAPLPKILLTQLNSYVREYFSVVLIYIKVLFGIL